MKRNGTSDSAVARNGAGAGGGGCRRGCGDVGAGGGGCGRWHRHGGTAARTGTVSVRWYKKTRLSGAIRPTLFVAV